MAFIHKWVKTDFSPDEDTMLNYQGTYGNRILIKSSIAVKHGTVCAIPV